MSLQSLERQGFRDIFVFCHSNEGSVANYVSERNSKRKQKIQIIHNQDTNTFSSLIRDVYVKKIIKEDFIIIDAHLVTDLNLVKLTQEFYHLKENNKNFLLMNVLS